MPTTPPTITALPAPPDPNDRSTFNTRAYPWSVAQQTLATEVGNVATNVYNNAVETASNAAAAADSVTDADSAAASAATSAASAINAPGTQATSTTSLALTTGAKSATIQTGKSISPGQQFVWARASAPATRMFTRIDSYDSGTGAINFTSLAVEGSGTYTDWVVSMGVASVAGTPDLPRVTRTSNTALVDADKGKWIDITSGSFTQTFGTRSPGWWCILGNSGTGDIDITTDGVAYKMYTQEKRYLIYDGTNTLSFVINGYYKVFTTSDVWTKPPGYTAFAGELIAAGASGDRKATGTSRAGGGGGALTPFRFLSSQMSTTEVLVLGAPGAAVLTDSTLGNAGGNATFKGLTSQGGRGGAAGSTGAVGGAAFNQALNPVTRGGAESGDIYTYYGGGGSSVTAQSGGTVYGASGGDSINSSNARVTAVPSVFGAAGGTCNAAGTVITPGGGAGAGGAASTNGTASGAGFRGELRIWGEI